MMAVLTGPLCLLCFYLSYLCVRVDCRKQAIVLGGFALFFLALTVGIFYAGYISWSAFESGAV